MIFDFGFLNFSILRYFVTIPFMKHRVFNTFMVSDKNQCLSQIRFDIL